MAVVEHFKVSLRHFCGKIEENREELESGETVMRFISLVGVFIMIFSLTYFYEQIDTISDVIAPPCGGRASVSGWHALLSRAMHDGT
jgi:hypothetical protein